MTDQQILEKAIQKAIDAGWRPDGDDRPIIDINIFDGRNDNEPSWRVDVWYHKDKSEIPEGYQWINGSFPFASPIELIFNHDFAKALWGSPLLATHYIKEDSLVKISNPAAPDDDMLPAWQYHLQQMVKAENPLEYLKENM